MQDRTVPIGLVWLLDVPRGLGKLMTRREAIRLLGPASIGAWAAAPSTASTTAHLSATHHGAAVPDDQRPPLAPGAPSSPERIALIEAFKRNSEGLQAKFEARVHESDQVMPYRLFR